MEEVAIDNPFRLFIGQDLYFNNANTEGMKTSKITVSVVTPDPVRHSAYGMDI